MAKTRVCMLVKGDNRSWPPPDSALIEDADFFVGATAQAILQQLKEQKGVAPEAILWVAGVPSSEVRELVQALNGSITWLHSFSAGVDGLAGFLKEDVSGITLTNGRGAFSDSLAEYAITAALYFTKDIPRSQDNARECKWEQFKMGMLRGKTMGFLGWGHIAKTTAKLARAFGMRIIACRRQKGEESDVTFFEDRLDVMRESDFIVCSLPATAETAKFCGAAEFSAMKQNGVFISLGRGAVVDEAALLAALTNGTIRGAALDVFATEPLPKESPLWRLPKEKIYITSHNADLTEDYFSLGWDIWAQNHKAERSATDAQKWAVTPFDPAQGY